MPFVYILKSAINNSYYVGSCKNLNNRIKLHNNKKVKSTKRYAPWKLVYSENYPKLSDAINREMKIKSWKNRAAIEKLIKNLIIEDPRIKK